MMMDEEAMIEIPNRKCIRFYLSYRYLLFPCKQLQQKEDYRERQRMKERERDRDVTTRTREIRGHEERKNFLFFACGFKTACNFFTLLTLPMILITSYFGCDIPFCLLFRL
jgi:hypothetical protein